MSVIDYNRQSKRILMKELNRSTPDATSMVRPNKKWLVLNEFIVLRRTILFGKNVQLEWVLKGSVDFCCVVLCHDRMWYSHGVIRTYLYTSSGTGKNIGTLMTDFPVT